MLKFSAWQKGLIFVLTLGAIVAISVVQIVSVDSTTKTEATLFNLLQFFFSLFFAWFLSLYFGEAQFAASQKKFAIGAFRRIKEIERTINRTQKYVTYLERDENPITRAKIIAVNGGLDAMKDTVASSIADWSDIIGDEIEITRELNKLKNLRSADEEAHQKVSNDSISTENEAKISELKKALPAELVSEFEIDEEDRAKAALEALNDNYHENNKLVLSGFWESDGGFANNLSDISVGHRVFVAKGIAGQRTGALIVFNDKDEQVAVVTNACYVPGGSYDDFVDAIELFYDRTLIPKCFGGHPLTAIVESIEEYDHASERHHLTISIEQQPMHPSTYSFI